MKISNFLRLSLFAVLASITLSAKAQTSERPNISIILADDMRHGDLSINGGKTRTSNIDWIIKEGVRFSNFMIRY